ncbi:MAG: hypothetical protein ACM3SS_19070 [Rhodospirillaceae bacterium]
MCTRDARLASSRLIAGIALSDHERASATLTLARAHAIASFIVAVVKIPTAVLQLYRRNAAHPYPHPSHE